MTPARIDPYPYEGIPGIALHRVEGAGVSIRMLPSAPPPPPAERDAVDRHWDRLVRANPRLYNGPLLAVVAVDFEHAAFHCRRDEFKRLCAQPAVRTNVRLLSVTGVVLADDASGRPHVLLGRRGRDVRSYPGLWELGPAGGIPPPHPSVDHLGEIDVRAQLLEEAAEELGLPITPGPIRLLARDAVAMSDDLVVECRASSVEDASDALAAGGSHAWEYQETRWVPLDILPQFDASHADEIIGTTRAIFRGLGWIPID